MKTLEQLLEGQDLSLSITCQMVLDGNPVDSLTQVIIDAWNDNGGPEGELDMDSYRNALAYAIHQLNKALVAAN